MAIKPGFTKVATSAHLAQASLRTMALDIKSVSVGKNKPQPEIVTPPNIKLPENRVGGEVQIRHFHWLKTLALLLILVGMAMSFYFFGWSYLADALGI